MNLEEFLNSINKEYQRKEIKELNDKIRDLVFSCRKDTFSILADMFEQDEPYAEFLACVETSPGDAQTIVNAFREVCNGLFDWMDEVIRMRRER